MSEIIPAPAAENPVTQRQPVIFGVAEKKILEQVKELLNNDPAKQGIFPKTTKEAWCKGVDAMTARGSSCTPTSPLARQWSLVGAVEKVTNIRFYTGTVIELLAIAATGEIIVKEDPPRKYGPTWRLSDPAILHVYNSQPSEDFRRRRMRDELRRINNEARFPQIIRLIDHAITLCTE